MLTTVSDISAVCIGLASLVGVIDTARARVRLAACAARVGPMLAFTMWSAAASFYLRSPLSPLRARVLLAALCAGSAPWLISAVPPGERDSWRVWVKSKWLTVIVVGAAGVSTLVMYWSGLDWVTGIGPEPVAVVSQSGLVALGAGAVLAMAGLCVITTQLVAGTDHLALLIGSAGAAASLLWTASATLWQGCLSPTLLVSTVSLGGAAAIVWTVGATRERPNGRVLRPSRRVVYGSVAAGVVVAYGLAAHVALRWTAELARTAFPCLLPGLAFAGTAALVVVGGSERWRHRLWTAVGRHLYGTKHDYGDVWINLTERVTAAECTSELLQRTAAYCRKLLCAPEVTVWLVNERGQLWCAAKTPAGGADTYGRDTTPGAPVATAVPESSTPSGARGGPQTAALTDEAVLTRATRSSFACPMRVNGHLLGVLAVGTSDRPALLDKEDRRVIRHIAAQVASAVGLHRLGEELADARQVGSFHRLSAFVLHDLKNLAAQQSFVLENAGRFRDNPAFVTDALAAFEDSTNRMRSLIAKLRSPKPAATPGDGSCDLCGLLRALVGSSQLQARPGCVVHLSVPPGVVTCVAVIDPGAAVQLFENLLANALESLPPGGGMVAVSITRLDRAWQVTVADNGHGIPETFLRERLFRPFHTTKESGLGIGLYQCKTIVDAVAGNIAVDSTEHVGTTVAVTLRARPDAAVALSASLPKRFTSHLDGYRGPDPDRCLQNPGDAGAASLARAQSGDRQPKPPMWKKV